jgi:F-type H+-transporting ATPase subunit c
MTRAGIVGKALVVGGLAVALVLVVNTPVVLAQQAGQTGAGDRAVWHLFGAALGLGMIVIGAALGIGRFAAAAAEGIARQPSAASQITGAVNLPLFLLEGVAILAEVFVLLIVLLNGRP